MPGINLINLATAKSFLIPYWMVDCVFFLYTLRKVCLSLCVNYFLACVSRNVQQRGMLYGIMLCEQDQPHAQHSVDVAANSLDVGSHEVGLGGLHAEILDHGLHGCHDPLLLVSVVQVRHIARVQDVIYVLQERLALNLKSSKSESVCVSFGALCKTKWRLFRLTLNFTWVSTKRKVIWTFLSPAFIMMFLISSLHSDTP